MSEQQRTIGAVTYREALVAGATGNVLHDAVPGREQATRRAIDRRLVDDDARRRVEAEIERAHHAPACLRAAKNAESSSPHAFACTPSTTRA